MFLRIKLTDCLMAFVLESVKSSCFKQTYHLQRNFFDQVVRLEKNLEETSGMEEVQSDASADFPHALA